MNKNEKINFVKSLATEIKDQNVILYGFHGLSADNFKALRKAARNSGYKVRVIKNTLLKKIFEAGKIEGLDPVLSNETAVIYGAHDFVNILKDVKKINQEIKLGSFKAGFIEKKFFNSEEILKLSNMPARNVLLANLAGTLNAPLSGFVFCLSFNLIKLITVLENVKKNKEKNKLN